MIPRRCLLPQTANILMGANLHRIHPIQFGSVIEKMVMVHGLRHKVFCARFHIKGHQRIRIKALRFPQRADVLIAKL